MDSIGGSSVPASSSPARPVPVPGSAVRPYFAPIVAAKRKSPGTKHGSAIARSLDIASLDYELITMMLELEESGFYKSKFHSITLHAVL